MSLDQLEKEIQQLSASDLAQFGRWFSSFWSSRVSTSDENWRETEEQIAELERRLAEFQTNPAVVAPFDPDYFSKLKRQLADERATKASSS